MPSWFDIYQPNMMKYVVFPQLLQDGKKGEALKMAAFDEYDQK